MTLQKFRSAIILLTAACCFTPLMFFAGCAVPSMIGGMAQNAEYQKKVNVPAEYTGLENREIAVLVDVDMATMYEHPRAASEIAKGVAFNIQKHVPGARVINPQTTMAWQYRTPAWNLMSYGDVADELGVERVVVIEIYEYRLHPPGNRYEWEGVCAATVRVIEDDGNTIDANLPVRDYDIIARFPDVSGVTLDSGNASNVEAGLIIEFIKQTVYLFYDHIEPKYPDKYRPELDR